MAVFDNMWGKTRSSLLQLKMTTEQVEHDHLMDTIENLDSCAYYSKSLVEVDHSDMVIGQNNNFSVISQFNIHSFGRITLYEGSVNTKHE